MMGLTLLTERHAEQRRGVGGGQYYLTALGKQVVARASNSRSLSLFQNLRRRPAADFNILPNFGKKLTT